MLNKREILLIIKRIDKIKDWSFALSKREKTQREKIIKKYKVLIF